MNYTTEVTEDNKLMVSFPDLNGILIWNGSLEGFQKAFFENILQPSGKITESGKLDFVLLNAYNKSFLLQNFKKTNPIDFNIFKRNSQIELVKTTKSFNSDFGVFTLEYENGKPIKVLNENEKFLNVILLAIENETIDRVLSKFFNIVEIDLPKFVIKEDNERVDFDDIYTILKGDYTKLKGDAKFDLIDLDSLGGNFSRLFISDSGKFVVEYANGIPINVTGENQNLVGALNTSIMNGGFEGVLSDPYLNAIEIDDVFKKEFEQEMENQDIFFKEPNDFRLDNKKDYSGGTVFFSINGIIELIENIENVDSWPTKYNNLIIKNLADKNSKFYMTDSKNFVGNQKLQVGDSVEVDFYINCVKSSKNIWLNNFDIKSIRKI
ncbi:MAG: hypothetical protein ACEQSR_12455 [Candidatus Methylacidiphilales bacterium]